MEQEKPLDGGLPAWSTVIGGWVHQLVSSILCLNSSSLLTVAVTFGYTNSFGVYQDLYTRSNTASASAISWIGATQMFFIFAMALPAGKLLDMGYFRLTTIVGSIIYVFSWAHSLSLVPLPLTISEYSCYLYVTKTNSTNYILHRDWAWELVPVFSMLPVSPFRHITGALVEALLWELLPPVCLLHHSIHLTT